jgi:hypothetical protein
VDILSSPAIVTLLCKLSFGSLCGGVFYLRKRGIALDFVCAGGIDFVSKSRGKGKNL